MHNFPSTEWPPTTGLGWDSVFVSLALQWPRAGWFACFPMGLVHWNAPWQMPGIVRRKSAGWCENPADFQKLQGPSGWQVFFFFGWLKILHYLRTRTPIETFWHFCGFIAWKRAVFDHIGEKSGSLFLLQLREARWNDAAETHAVTHGYLPSQYPIIFYFWVVQ